MESRKPLVDDIGSFPLPANIHRDDFDSAYRKARNMMAHGYSTSAFIDDEFIRKNFYDVTLNSFRKKLQAGLDVVNYPQQFSGMDQVGDSISKAMDHGTYTVDEREAFLPEVELVKREGKRLYEEFGKIILLRISLFGPMEHYVHRLGQIFYKKEAESFAETVRLFAKKSIVNSKYVKTAVVSIDEPSFGFTDIDTTSDNICDILEKAFDFEDVITQIHLHSSSRLHDLLKVNNLDVLSFEYAASPKNIKSVSRKMLEDADKRIRVGVSRTDIDSIMAELHDKGVTKPTAEQLVESGEAIKKRYVSAKQKFGERMTFTGPDCGLGSWPSQEAAQLLLKRTVDAVKKV
jgi:5-methyltetrahydropteroyltriglutamate--homocysteine methyltransferase